MTILAAGALGAALLLVSEFTTLYFVHVAGRSVRTVSSQGTGAHHSYALVPIALLAALFAFGGYRFRARPAWVALGALAVFALLIALLGDLPDAHVHGLTQNFVLASSTPGVGLYLETLGAMAMLLAAGFGTTLRSAFPRPAVGRRTR